MHKSSFHLWGIDAGKTHVDSLVLKVCTRHAMSKRCRLQVVQPLTASLDRESRTGPPPPPPWCMPQPKVVSVVDGRHDAVERQPPRQHVRRNVLRRGIAT